MSIDGINKGGYMPLPTGQDALPAGAAGKAAAAAGLQVVGTPQAAKPNEALSQLLSSAGGNPAAGLKTPAELDKKMAAEASGSLGKMGGADVTADIYSFMALFQQMAQGMRNTARTERTTALQGQVTAMQNAADQMKATAALRFAAGVVSGSMQIAGGLAQVGMSSASMASTVKGANMDASGRNTIAAAETGSSKGMGATQQFDMKTMGNNQVAQGAGLTAAGLKQNALGQAAGGIAGGLGGVISSGLNYAADLSDAKKAKFDIEAKVQDTAVAHANDMMQQMMDAIRDVKDKLQSIQQAAVETNRGIARNI